MKSITLRETRDTTGALTTFSVGLGFDDKIVFNEGTYYPPAGSAASREYDEYVTVAAADLPRLATLLKCTTDRETLLDALANRARRDGVKSAWDARRLLTGLGIPWEKSTWISHGDD